MKRKVAVGMTGNFRGVCPILNRAIVITNTVCDKISSASYDCVCARTVRSCVVLQKSGNFKVSQTFFDITESDTHG